MSFLEDDLCCPVCCDTFQEPVVLSCSHSFCRVCLEESWRSGGRSMCPTCRCSFPPGFRPPINLALKNIVEAYLRNQQEEVEAATEQHGTASSAGGGRTTNLAADSDTGTHCTLHGERLLLFCKVDQEAICMVCQTSKRHLNHPLCPLDEAVLDKKEEITASLKAQRERLEAFQKVEQECLKTMEHIKSQSSWAELQIKEEFKALHHFLWVEEQGRLEALTDETERKRGAVTEKMEEVTNGMALLSDAIVATEREVHAGNLSSMQNYNSNRRSPCILQIPPLASGMLIDVAKHLGSLRFRVWKKMLEIVQYCPVTLDPNTAAPWLTFSPDLTAVWYADEQPQLPSNPERCDPCVCVLGADGFVGGRHCWEVEVGDKTKWDVGVLRQSIQRKGVLNVNPAHGFWAIALRDGFQYSACTQPWTRLALQRRPQKIWIELDYDKGEVSFFNPSDMSHIYTFRERFSERVFPYFSPCINDRGSNAGALKICPAKVSILTQQRL